MQRRTFMKSLGVATAAGASFGILRHPRRAEAYWGEWPADKLDAMIPVERQAKNVLELYLYGGMNAFDTFYAVPDWGQDTERFLHAYYNQTQARFGQCGLGNTLTDEFAEDANGLLVHLGPWVAPLRARPDIVSRMRILVQRHDLLPHEGANPYALTGSRLGSPRLAGVGASIQRHFLEQPGGLRPTPYAYVLYPGVEFPTDNVLAASAIGLHPGSARPLSVTVDPGSSLSQLLARPSVGAGRDSYDAAVDHYLAAYQQRFRPGGKGQLTRSAERSNFEFAHFARRGAGELSGVLSADLFEGVAGTECSDMSGTDKPRMQARMAASLLTRAQDRARYVHWIDGGLKPNPSAGHDTHDSHVEDSSRNVTHTMQCLADIINAPNENDPGKINLDETMIVINTEFGRTPHRQGQSGLNHWPQGMVNVLIGGPITEAERGIYGAITEAEGFAETYISPAENRMLVMMALGIYPFSSQTFAVGDVAGGVKNQAEAAQRLRDIYMGLKL
ncbi:DUF1501 domain-containing protein [Nannocystis pusilla]|uniref:DUF1501 domain-containing protein n=1 Tax=Nannocystis pusilla TaxID=889268 RepID=UPI003B78BC17